MYNLSHTATQWKMKEEEETVEGEGKKREREVRESDGEEENGKKRKNKRGWRKGEEGKEWRKGRGRLVKGTVNKKREEITHKPSPEQLYLVGNTALQRFSEWEASVFQKFEQPKFQQFSYIGREDPLPNPPLYHFICCTIIAFTDYEWESSVYQCF